jgi:hypothetical protein
VLRRGARRAGPWRILGAHSSGATLQFLGLGECQRRATTGHLHASSDAVAFQWGRSARWRRPGRYARNRYVFHYGKTSRGRH